VPDVLAGLMLQ